MLRGWVAGCIYPSRARVWRPWEGDSLKTSQGEQVDAKGLGQVHTSCVPSNPYHPQKVGHLHLLGPGVWRGVKETQSYLIYHFKNFGRCCKCTMSIFILFLIIIIFFVCHASRSQPLCGVAGGTQRSVIPFCLPFLSPPSLAISISSAFEKDLSMT